MKDPLLLSYTFEELLYEFYSVREHEEAIIERVKQEADKIEEAKEEADLDWVARMEAEEAAAEASDPSNNPDNIKWMEEQLALDKETFGEDFGEDINLDFNSTGQVDDQE
jgi:hypothetical protein